MPSSILNSDDGVISGTSGIKAVGGDDGVLVFQSKGTETARINTDKQIVAAAGTASLPVLTTTGDVNTGIYFPAADNIGFATGGTIRGRWTTDGLCFGSDTAAANALDDYEEGTWTPVIADAPTGGNTGTRTLDYARYTKIGNVVTVDMYISSINTTGMTAGNIFYIRGLPFTSSKQATGAFYTYRVGRDASTVSSSVFVNNNSTSLLFFLFTTNSATTDKTILVSNMVSGTSQIIFSLTYIA